MKSSLDTRTYFFIHFALGMFLLWKPIISTLVTLSYAYIQNSFFFKPEIYKLILQSLCLRFTKFVK